MGRYKGSAQATQISTICMGAWLRWSIGIREYNIVIQAQSNWVHMHGAKSLQKVILDPSAMDHTQLAFKRMALFGAGVSMDQVNWE